MIADGKGGEADIGPTNTLTLSLFEAVRQRPQRRLLRLRGRPPTKAFWPSSPLLFPACLMPSVLLRISRGEGWEGRGGGLRRASLCRRRSRHPPPDGDSVKGRSKGEEEKSFSWHPDGDRHPLFLLTSQSTVYPLSPPSSLRPIVS